MEKTEKFALLGAIVFGILTWALESAFFEFIGRSKYYSWGLFSDPSTTELDNPTLLVMGLINLLLIVAGINILFKYSSKRVTRKLRKQTTFLYVFGAIFVLIYGIIIIQEIDGQFGYGWNFWNPGFGIFALFIESAIFFYLSYLRLK